MEYIESPVEMSCELLPLFERWFTVGVIKEFGDAIDHIWDGCWCDGDGTEIDINPEAYDFERQSMILFLIFVWDPKSVPEEEKLYLLLGT